MQLVDEGEVVAEEVHPRAPAAVVGMRAEQAEVVVRLVHGWVASNCSITSSTSGARSPRSSSSSGSSRSAWASGSSGRSGGIQSVAAAKPFVVQAQP